MMAQVSVRAFRCLVFAYLLTTRTTGIVVFALFRLANLLALLSRR